MAFNITTTAFEYGKSIPAKHACTGDDLSPQLSWDDVPKGTTSLALTIEDPDAPGGTFTHWIVYNLPADSNGLEAIVPIQKHLANGATQGKNDFGKTGYGGPCPPKGQEHRYFFRLFALKKKLPPESANDANSFHQAISGLIIEEAEYMGKFKK
ncbi:MAG TPA: YbhB/YbcL family Raf kinase inhibitor-like protein [Sunxiuqinia sp.]|nr:YbhB/YbcL family Raf kinase inhibitor-like protein [Sunxiuqinia sp.]